MFTVWLGTSLFTISNLLWSFPCQFDVSLPFYRLQNEDWKASNLAGSRTQHRPDLGLFDLETWFFLHYAILPVKLTCSNVSKHSCWVPWWLAIDLSVVSQDLSWGLQALLIWKCPPKCVKMSQSLRDFLQSQTSTRLWLCRHATVAQGCFPTSEIFFKHLL